MTVLQQISESLQRGEDKKVAELTRQAIDDGLAAGQILNEGLLAGMDVVSQRFGANEIFLPEVLRSARAADIHAREQAIVEDLACRQAGIERLPGQLRDLLVLSTLQARADLLHDVHFRPPARRAPLSTHRHLPATNRRPGRGGPTAGPRPGAAVRSAGGTRGR